MPNDKSVSSSSAVSHSGPGGIGAVKRRPGRPRKNPLPGQQAQAQNIQSVRHAAPQVQSRNDDSQNDIDFNDISPELASQMLNMLQKLSLRPTTMPGQTGRPNFNFANRTKANTLEEGTGSTFPAGPSFSSIPASQTGNVLDDKIPHMARIEKAREGLPALNEASQKIIGLSKELDDTELTVLIGHLDLVSRERAIIAAVNLEPFTAGQRVRIVAGNPYYLDKYATVLESKRLRSSVQIEEDAHVLKMFNSHLKAVRGGRKSHDANEDT